MEVFTLSGIPQLFSKTGFSLYHFQQSIDCFDGPYNGYLVLRFIEAPRILFQQSNAFQCINSSVNGSGTHPAILSDPFPAYKTIGLVSATGDNITEYHFLISF